MAPPRWFLAVYALSGAAALVYEVAWTRLLTLYLGHGIAAASTVLAAFMGGLAVGAGVAGPKSDHTPRARAMRTYAVLELVIAGLALAMPFGMSAVAPLLAGAYADGDGGAAFAGLRLMVSVVAVALPAVAMGATFPYVARWYVPNAGAATRDAGALYAANTIGAALGALVTGFVLLPALGLRATTAVGVAMNLAVAAAAWTLAGRVVAAGAPAEIPVPVPVAGTPPARSGRKAVRPVATPALGLVPRPMLAALALGISGFLSLGLQIVWSRLLAQILGPTTYAFSLVVAIFISGLALGALLGRKLADRAAQPAAGLAAVLAVAVTAVSLSAWTVDAGLRAMAEVVASPQASFESVLLRQVLLVAGWLLPLAIALGCAFPFAIRTGTGREQSLGADLGLIYAVNTIGAIAGSLAAAFVLIPAWGLHGSLRALGVGATAAAVALVLAAGVRGRARLWTLAGCGVAAAATALLPQWSPTLMSSGAYKYAASMTPETLEVSLAAGHLLYYREGAVATVSVREAAGTTSLAIDGKVDASNAGDMLTQRLLAHVPMLLHPAPRRAAILGLGSGVTLGSALRHPVERVDVLEISPEVVEASRFFEPENGAALRDARTRLIVGDGRTHVMLGRSNYDVIISEPSNPWMAGIASLFTREFFAVGPGPAGAGRRAVPVGPHLRHQRRRSALDRRHLRRRVPRRHAVAGRRRRRPARGLERARSARASRPCRRCGRPVPKRPGDLAGVGAKGPFALLSLLVAEGPALAPVCRQRAAPDRRLPRRRIQRAAHGLLPRRRRQQRRPAGPRRRATRGGGDGGAGGGLGRGVARSRLDAARRQRRAAGVEPTSRPPCASIRPTRAPSRGWSGPAPPPASSPRPWPCCANWRRRRNGSRRSWPCRASWPRREPPMTPPAWRSRPSGASPRISARWSNWPRCWPMSATATASSRSWRGCGPWRPAPTPRAITRPRCSSWRAAPMPPRPRRAA